MPWPPGPSQQPVVEITLPLPEPARQPAVGYPASYRALEAEIRRLNATVEELAQQVAELQKQQQPVRRRTRWYRRLTILETWTDNDQA